MSDQRNVDHGRVDHLARGIFNKLLKAHANPHVRFACRMLDQEIAECFEENLGPGTSADKIGKRVIRAIEGGR